ncbi:hypothetical protein [Polyangium spumosum]|uniref:Uncharacterized protein n=1 Tax=Polyangium spumosum TaxID=889282 RepID=A0A6N7PJZ8_9BACT|nr:hypothetical protein [Polyangium spumosum]MRG92363.1 hypothetical protein [Polyangium spumosum]
MNDDALQTVLDGTTVNIVKEIEEVLGCDDVPLTITDQRAAVAIHL